MCVTILYEDFQISNFRNFEIATYGDDNIITCAINNLTVDDFSPHFKRRFDMDYTHYTKMATTNVIDTLDNISYLSRKFVYVGSKVCFAPLPLQTIIETTYYNHHNTEHAQLLTDSFRSFVNELFHHGQHVQEELVKLYLSKVRERLPLHYGLLLQNPVCYSEMYHRFYM
jgi:hypothetical protein